MNKYKKFKDKFTDYLFDSSIYIKDRTFVLFSICMASALLVFSFSRFILDYNLSSLIISLFAAAISFGMVHILAKKNKFRAAKIAISLILVLFLRPAAFFASGGIHNGSLLMFLMGAYYLVLVLDGKFRIFMCLLDFVIYLTLGIVAYNNPALLPEVNVKEDYVSSYTQYVIAFLVLTVLITFWTMILKKEAAIAEEKSKELDELNKSQNRFFSSMSHEIRTPINTVLGLNEIILRQPDASEEIKKDARNIQGAGKMLLALINDILDLSKIEAGKMDVVPVDYDVSSLLSEIVNMIWLKAQNKGLEFKVGIDPGVPQKLYGDEVRIKQILINLLNNAVKYTQKGFVSLYMECEPAADNKVLLKINVTDSGIGIKADALPHLFDTFQRQDEEKNRYIEGTGLGLSIVKQLVELMDGDIRVDSVYARGTTFSVEIRQGVSSNETVGDINVFSSGGLSGDGKFEHSFHSPDGRILIVDDNEMNLTVESKLLEGTELTVDLSESGADALSKTLKEQYDVIFMDHLMPGMDGIECFRQIRRQSGGLNRNTPVIVLTANAGGENIELYNNTGFDGYLVKPVSGRQLEEMLISFIPQEKLITAEKNEITGSSMSTARGYRKKRQVVIATDTMSDIPRSIIRELQISIIPVKIRTDKGLFYDTYDIDSDELLHYMEDSAGTVQSVPPSKEELIKFFAAELQKAHNLIFISHGAISKEYVNALEASKSFGNVTVLNTHNTSTAVGLLAMVAARLAQQNARVENIVSEVNRASELLHCSFIIKNTDFLTRRGQISPAINNLLNTLWLRPVLQIKEERIGVHKFLFGADRKCHTKFISDSLSAKNHPDEEFVFVTYAGIDENDLEFIEAQINSRVKFKHIVFQKASSGLVSNTGPGTFGITFFEKGESRDMLSDLLPHDIQNDGPDTEEELFDTDEDTDDTSVSADGPAQGADNTLQSKAGPDTEKEEEKEPEWYERIPELDTKAAVKNSGSKELFLSVLKIYYDSYQAKSDELKRYYDDGDWENYTVKIHALKSSSRLVGALALGNDAEKLEMAGKEGNIEYISANHASAMEQYKNIVDSLSAEFGTKEDPDLPEIDPSALSELYEGLSEFAFAKDLELARMVIASAGEYRLPAEDAERFRRLQAKVEQMDWDGITEIVKEVNR
ncbi:MAG: DegV family protein [Lachnospiraceae bacterium]|nr:DegV family protein [Lachnospiraceae bacterium]